MQTQTKICQNCKNQFTIEPEDFVFYEKIKVPAPTFCPECRMQRRLTFRSEMILYKRKSDFTNKEIFSMYSPDIPIKVYEYKIWHSDQWDPMEYGRDYDFNISFFEQFNKLALETPRFNLSVLNMINSDYCNNANDMKNCYLIFNANYNEDCIYGNGVSSTKDSVEISHVHKCELCYECLMCIQCYKTFFSIDCTNCYNVYFSKNCSNCSNCFGCVNLRNKQYYIFNKPYSKEDYLNKFEEFKLNLRSVLIKIKKETADFWLKFPNKYMHGNHNNNVSGDYLHNSKNIFYSWNVNNAEDSKWCQYLLPPSNKDCYDYSVWGDNAELIYETAVCGINIRNLKFCHECWNSFDLNYCSFCSNSSNLFGCFGLKNKQYCILNKQYTKEEYEELVPKIIKHMNNMPYVDKNGRVYKYGEFFPIELSSFSYNETIAFEHFPLSKERIEKEGYGYSDLKKHRGVYSVTLKAENLPDNIDDVEDNIINEVIECANAKIGVCRGVNVFKIIKQELQFYKNHNLPLPDLCPNCRHYQRIKQRNPLKLWHRQCQCAGEKSDNKVYQNTIQHFHSNEHCPNEFETTYSPDRKEIVYCEKCYQQEVY